MDEMGEKKKKNRRRKTKELGKIDRKKVCWSEMEEEDREGGTTDSGLMRWEKCVATSSEGRALEREKGVFVY